MLVRRGTVEGMELIDNHAPFICNSCEHTKSTCKVIWKEREAPLANAFGAEVHSNLWGPSPTQSLGKRKYHITFTDDHTHYTLLAILYAKDGALDAYKDFAAWAHTQHGVHIKRLHSDRGREYTGSKFSEFLRGQGTEHWLTTHDTLQHNGVADSLNRRLVECMLALLVTVRSPCLSVDHVLGFLREVISQIGSLITWDVT